MGGDVTMMRKGITEEKMQVDVNHCGTAVILMVMVMIDDGC